MKRKVKQYTLDGTLVATYENGTEAAKAVGVSKMAISMNVTGKTKQCAGYVFKFEEVQHKSTGSKRTAAELAKEAIGLSSQLLGFALKLTANMEDSRDLVQDAYCKFFSDFKDDGRASAFTFLCTQIKNGVKKIEKAERVPLSDVLYRLNDVAADEADEQAVLEARDRKMRNVETKMFSDLSDGTRKRMKQIYRLYLLGYSTKEIAERTGLTEGSAQQRVLEMRKHVASYAGMNVRDFTWKNCTIKA